MATSLHQQKKKRALLKLPGSQHKKNDDVDEESRMAAKNGDYMEKQYKRENEAKIDALADAVSSIKQMSRNTGRQLEEEKQVQKELDTGFGKGKQMVTSVVSSMDTMLN
mmetsp:Transcript_9498/g.11710  ORF Transcript_9498/g.11710 Transcript_9498/m.11710 type:complete len:109 (+) Transcript_9498:53-379(+)